MREIPVGRNYTAIVDDEDYNDLIQFRWYAFNRRRNRTIYAYRFVPTHNNPKGAWEYMHKRITGYEQTDHRNHNGLDNRRENLRDATNAGNRRNTEKQRGDYSSQYKGVCWDKSRNKWTVNIQVDRMHKHLGRFTDEIEAAKAYDRAAMKYFGEFALLNFPQNGESNVEGNE